MKRKRNLINLCLKKTESRTTKKVSDERDERDKRPRHSSGTEKKRARLSLAHKWRENPDEKQKYQKVSRAARQGERRFRISKKYPLNQLIRNLSGCTKNENFIPLDLGVTLSVAIIGWVTVEKWDNDWACRRSALGLGVSIIRLIIWVWRALVNRSLILEERII